jgi:hypothetical protein
MGSGALCPGPGGWFLVAAIDLAAERASGQAAIPSPGYRGHGPHSGFAAQPSEALGCYRDRSVSSNTIWLILIFVVFPLLGIPYTIAARRWEARRADELAAYAGESGWRAVNDAEVAGSIAVQLDMAGRKPRLMLARPDDMCFSWHTWTTGSGRGTRRHDRVRFVRRLDKAVTEPITVKRRLLAEALIGPVRDPTATERAFARSFAIEPRHNPAAAERVPAALRHALVAGQVPPFRLVGRLAVVEYKRRPTPQWFTAWDEELGRLAALLSVDRDTPPGR